MSEPTGESVPTDRWVDAAQFHAFVAHWLNEHEPHIAMRAQADFFRDLGFSVPYVPEPTPDVFDCPVCPRRFFTAHGRHLHLVRKHPEGAASGGDARSDAVTIGDSGDERAPRDESGSPSLTLPPTQERGRS